MEHWLDRVYDKHAPALYRFIMRLTGHEADTRDTLQDIFVRLAKAPRMLEGVAAPRSFLFRMAHRLVIDGARRKSVRDAAHERAAAERDADSRPVSIGEDNEERQLIAACLQALPLEQRSVVVLKIWEEMTFAEISAVLDISPNTAASRYRYALDKMRPALRPLHNDLP